MRWLYAAVAGVGLIGVALISYGQFTGQSSCPQLGPLPICYAILVNYAVVVASAFVKGTARRWMFWPGWAGIFTAAAFGSSMELLGHVTCPRSDGDVPTCYFSLAMSIAVLVLYLLANKGIDSSLKV